MKMYGKKSFLSECSRNFGQPVTWALNMRCFLTLRRHLSQAIYVRKKWARIKAKL